MIKTSQYISSIEVASQQSPAIESGKIFIPSSSEDKKKFNRFGEEGHKISDLAGYIHKNLPKNFTQILNGFDFAEKISFISKSSTTFSKVNSFVDSKKESEPVGNTAYLKVQGGAYYGKVKNRQAEGPGILCHGGNIWIATFENNELKADTKLTQITSDGIIKQYTVASRMKLATFNKKWKSDKDRSPVRSGDLYYCDTSKNIELLAKVAKSKVVGMIGKAPNLYYKSKAKKVAVLDSNGYRFTNSPVTTAEESKAEKDEPETKESPTIKKGKFIFQKEALEKSSKQTINYDGKILEGNFSATDLGLGSEKITLNPGILIYKVSNLQYIFEVDKEGNLDTLVTVQTKSKGENVEYTSKADIDKENISNINLSKTNGQEKLNRILKQYTKQPQAYLKTQIQKKAWLEATRKKVESSPKRIAQFVEKLERLDLVKHKDRVSRITNQLQEELLGIADNLISIYQPGPFDIKLKNNGAPLGFAARRDCEVNEEIYELVLPGNYRLRVKRYVGVDNSVNPPVRRNTINGVSVTSLKAMDSKLCINYESEESYFRDQSNQASLQVAKGKQQSIKFYTITCSKQGGCAEMTKPFVLFKYISEGEDDFEQFKQANDDYRKKDPCDSCFEWLPKSENPKFVHLKPLIERKSVDGFIRVLETGFNTSEFSQEWLFRYIDELFAAYPNLRQGLLEMFHAAIESQLGGPVFQDVFKHVVSQVESNKL